MVLINLHTHIIEREDIITMKKIKNGVTFIAGLEKTGWLDMHDIALEARESGIISFAAARYFFKRDNLSDKDNLCRIYLNIRDTKLGNSDINYFHHYSKGAIKMALRKYSKYDAKE